ncbi:hypothetical protein VTJ49DRAFT_4149 [Mycothermus thermophilus]|uniref:Uncharacterized protein n=1 Tax=Humicola insolens TaxID=85995 RepID=A0ABR3VLP8_HUMIN
MEDYTGARTLPTHLHHSTGSGLVHNRHYQPRYPLNDSDDDNNVHDNTFHSPHYHHTNTIRRHTAPEVYYPAAYPSLDDDHTNHTNHTTNNSDDAQTKPIPISPRKGSLAIPPRHHYHTRHRPRGYVHADVLAEVECEQRRKNRRDRRGYRPDHDEQDEHDDGEKKEEEEEGWFFDWSPSPAEGSTPQTTPAPAMVDHSAAIPRSATGLQQDGLWLGSGGIEEVVRNGDGDGGGGEGGGGRGYFPLHEEPGMRRKAPHPFYRDAERARRASIQLAATECNRPSGNFYYSSSSSSSSDGIPSLSQPPQPQQQPQKPPRQPTSQAPLSGEQPTDSTISPYIPDDVPLGVVIPTGKYYPTNWEKRHGQPKLRAPVTPKQSTSTPQLSTAQQQPGHEEYSNQPKESSVSLASGLRSHRRGQISPVASFLNRHGPISPQLGPIECPGTVTPISLEK